MNLLPLLIEPETLEHHLGDDDILVVDLSKADTYRQLHVPGAVFLDYGRIVEGGAAELLGLKPTTLADRIRTYKIKRPSR